MMRTVTGISWQDQMQLPLLKTGPYCFLPDGEPVRKSFGCFQSHRFQHLYCIESCRIGQTGGCQPVCLMAGGKTENPAFPRTPTNQNITAHGSG